MFLFFYFQKKFFLHTYIIWTMDNVMDNCSNNWLMILTRTPNFYLVTNTLEFIAENFAMKMISCFVSCHFSFRLFNSAARDTIRLFSSLLTAAGLSLSNDANNASKGCDRKTPKRFCPNDAKEFQIVPSKRKIGACF